MIGVDTPGFNNEWLAIATVTLLGLVKEKLKDSTSVSITVQCSLFKHYLLSNK